MNLIPGTCSASSLLSARSGCALTDGEWTSSSWLVSASKKISHTNPRSIQYYTNFTISIIKTKTVIVLFVPRSAVEVIC